MGEELNKGQLRRSLRERRDGLPAEERERLSVAATTRLLAHPTVAGASRVALYATIRSEVDTAAAHASLRARGVEVLYPRTDPELGRLLFVRCDDRASLRPGTFGVPEPAGPPVALSSIDCVVIPGLAFDREGGRLGYGAGYYDRTLAAYAGSRLGLAFGFQVLDRLPQDPHDLRVDAVVTEAGGG